MTFIPIYKNPKSNLYLYQQPIHPENEQAAALALNHSRNILFTAIKHDLDQARQQRIVTANH